MSIVAVGISVLAIVLIATWRFGHWLRSQTDITTQDKIGSWEIFIKLIGGVGIIIGAIFTVWQYLDQRERELVQRRMEFDQQVYDHKSKVYDEAIMAVSSLANATTLSEPTTQQNLKTFWDLYWGKMVRHENIAVETCMVQLARALKDWEEGGTKPSQLPQLSLSLAHAIRDDLSLTRPSYNR